MCHRASQKLLDAEGSGMTRWQWLIVLMVLTVNLAGCGGMQAKHVDQRVGDMPADAVEAPPSAPGEMR